MAWIAFGCGVFIGSIVTVVALGLVYMSKADEIRIYGAKKEDADENNNR